jgi:hypothetical protein
LRVSIAAPGIKPKTKPEQTLSVPFVFRNCLNFNEFVKAMESIAAAVRRWRRQRSLITMQGSPALAAGDPGSRTISALAVANIFSIEESCIANGVATAPCALSSRVART